MSKRDISPLLRQVRQFLLGRPHTLALRFEQDLVARDQPPPNIPGGSAHKLFANYYVNRDARREVAPPVNVNDQKLIGDGTNAARKPTPGKVYHWD